jgi:hypothetical protein
MPRFFYFYRSSGWISVFDVCMSTYFTEIDIPTRRYHPSFVDEASTRWFVSQTKHTETIAYNYNIVVLLTWENPA